MKFLVSVGKKSADFHCCLSLDFVSQEEGFFHWAGDVAVACCTFITNCCLMQHLPCTADLQFHFSQDPVLWTTTQSFLLLHQQVPFKLIWFPTSSNAALVCTVEGNESQKLWFTECCSVVSLSLALGWDKVLGSKTQLTQCQIQLAQSVLLQKNESSVPWQWSRNLRKRVMLLCFCRLDVSYSK